MKSPDASNSEPISELGRDLRDRIRKLRMAGALAGPGRVRLLSGSKAVLVDQVLVGDEDLDIVERELFRQAVLVVLAEAGVAPRGRAEILGRLMGASRSHVPSASSSDSPSRDELAYRTGDSAESARFAVGELIENRYEVCGIRHGGMGEVYVCRDATADASSTVAIKSFSDAMLGDEPTRRRFLRECEAWLRMGMSPNEFVLGLKRVFELDNKPYMVMDYCGGGSLRSLLRRRGQLPTHEAVEISTSLLVGLNSICDLHGIVHRDLKPDNILFTDSGVPKIADLGIAGFVGDAGARTGVPDGDGRLTQTGAFVGTLPYAAPEQLLGSGDLDSGVDLWAFGIVLYEMVMGHRPFDPVPRSAEALGDAILLEDPASLGLLRKTAPQSVCDVILKCLAKRRADRYSSFSDLASSWDRVIRLSTSPPIERFGFDRRIDLYRPALEDHWLDLFPDRRSDAEQRTVFNLASANGLAEAESYYKLDQYEAAIEATSKVLGDLSPTSYLGQALRGSLESGFQRDPATGKQIYAPPVEAIAAALVVRMKSYVAIIEERPGGASRVPEMVSLAELIVSSDFRGESVLDMCAQAFLKGGQFARSRSVVRTLLEERPDDTSLEYLLFLTLLLDEVTADEARSFAIDFIKRHAGSGDRMARYYCAKMAGGLNAWSLTADLAAETLELDPSNMEAMSLLCVGLANTDRMEEAGATYRRMKSANPVSHFVQQLSRFFE